MFLFVSCEKETYLNPDNVIIESLIREKYIEDSKQLYIREIMADTNHPNYNKAVLDTTEVNKILCIFQLVYNLNSPESNTVFNVYNIHALRCYSLNSIGLNVDVTAPEIINLVNGNIPTGNNALDNILTNYEFDSIKTAYSYPDFHWLSIYTKNSYNLKPLIKALEEIPSIFIAENNGGCLDGNNIDIERKMNKATIDFSIGRDDCPSGCIYRRHWIFRIKNNKAKFIKNE